MFELIPPLGKELSFVLFLIAAFAFSWLARTTIFNELDYYEIKYTPKTKRRTLWLIYFNIIAVSFWLLIFQHLLSRV